jgi:hypothetical protein
LSTPERATPANEVDKLNTKQIYHIEDGDAARGSKALTVRLMIGQDDPVQDSVQ